LDLSRLIDAMRAAAAITAPASACLTPRFD